MERRGSVEEDIISILGGIFSIIAGIHVIFQAITHAFNTAYLIRPDTVVLKFAYFLLSFYILILGIAIIFTGYLMIKKVFSKNIRDWSEYHYLEEPDKREIKKEKLKRNL